MQSMYLKLIETSMMIGFGFEICLEEFCRIYSSV